MLPVPGSRLQAAQQSEVLGSVHSSEEDSSRKFQGMSLNGTLPLRPSIPPFCTSVGLVSDLPGSKLRSEVRWRYLGQKSRLFDPKGCHRRRIIVPRFTWVDVFLRRVTHRVRRDPGRPPPSPRGDDGTTSSVVPTPTCENLPSLSSGSVHPFDLSVAVTLLLLPCLVAKFFSVLFSYNTCAGRDLGLFQISSVPSALRRVECLLF